MKLIPIVVLVDEDVLPILHGQVEAFGPDLLAPFTELKRDNGWTDTMIVGGTILAQALRLTQEATP